MNQTVKKALEEILKKRKKELKSAEVWLKQDMESLQDYRNTVLVRNREINQLKNEIADLTLELTGRFTSDA